MTVPYKPKGYATVTPYLMLADVAAFLPFAEKALEAKIAERVELPDGSVTHADVVIGDSHVMMGQGSGNWKPMPSMIHLYVPDADASYQRALEHGAQSVQPVTDQFYGDRSGGVRDPFGNLWWFATHVEDVPQEEMERRMKEAGKG
jgi:PhnB protein